MDGMGIWRRDTSTYTVGSGRDWPPVTLESLKELARRMGPGPRPRRKMIGNPIAFQGMFEKLRDRGTVATMDEMIQTLEAAGYDVEVREDVPIHDLKGNAVIVALDLEALNGLEQQAWTRPVMDGGQHG